MFAAACESPRRLIPFARYAILLDANTATVK